MISIKSAREIEIMRKAGSIAGGALKTAGEMIVPGVTTKKIDTHIRRYIESRGATPSFFKYRGFPANCCISVNDEVIHGMPRDDKILKDGDIVKIDVGANFSGYHGDCANTFYCGDKANIPPETEKLLRTTRECFYAAIEFAKVGCRIGDISGAIQKHAESAGFSVVREYVGHGIGKNLHEKPDIPNYLEPGKGRGMRMSEGLVIAVEPMVNVGTHEVMAAADKITIKTADGKLSAHYEHTVLILKDGYELLTLV